MALARTLRRNGLDVTVLGPSDASPTEAGVRALGPSIPVPTNGSVAPIAPCPAAMARTRAVLSDGCFEVVHIHEPLVPGPSLAALRSRQAPVVATFHRSGSSSLYTLFRPLIRHWSRKIDIRCAVSEQARETAQSAVGGAFEAVFNGVELEPFAQAAPWPTDSSTVLFLGRHESRKGLAVLLEALKGLPADVRLWVAGAGPETAPLRSRFGGDRRIEWLGVISDAERASRMRGADVFCAPSVLGESFGVVLLEAMAAGTPVVASDLPGYRSAARSDIEAVLVPPGDPAALARAIRRVLEDRALADRLVAAGALRSQDLSMDRLADRYMELYDRASRPPIGRRSPPDARRSPP